LCDQSIVNAAVLNWLVANVVLSRKGPTVVKEILTCAWLRWRDSDDLHGRTNLGGDITQVKEASNMPISQTATVVFDFLISGRSFPGICGPNFFLNLRCLHLTYSHSRYSSSNHSSTLCKIIGAESM
jgi:hypothetical protein